MDQLQFNVDTIRAAGVSRGDSNVQLFLYAGTFFLLKCGEGKLAVCQASPSPSGMLAVRLEHNARD